MPVPHWGLTLIRFDMLSDSERLPPDSIYTKILTGPAVHLRGGSLPLTRDER